MIMKNLILASLLAVACLVLPSAAQIRNSKHDLSYSSTTSGAKTTTSNFDEVCVFCHTPHSTSTTDLLWNRSQSSATYTVYSSSSMHGTVPQPGASSKKCLSCHDGTVTYNSILNTSATTPPAFSGTGKMDTTGSSSGVGTDLSNDHPIGFVYNNHQVLNSSRLRAATQNGSFVSVDASAPARSLPLIGNTVSSATLECSTCHDPHGVQGVSTFLRASNQGSSLCLTCHII
jgi:predicted CXXCH cytochrome family protein